MNPTTTRSLSAHQFTPGHSRDSSNASIISFPATSAYPSRSHSRWPSSSSSLATAPDSPVNVAKSALHDLLEDPAEREEFTDLEVSEDEPLCICDALFCEHQREWLSSSAKAIPLNEESTTSLRFNRDDDFSALPSTERRSSDPSSGHSLNTRVSLTWPSFSRHMRNRKAVASASSASIRSAPPSRSSSKRVSDRQALPSHVVSFSRRNTASSIAPPEECVSYCSSAGNWMLPSMSTSSTDVSGPQQDPIEREELSATPLLPPSLAQCCSDEPDSPRSPLQSPSIAALSTTDSVLGSPLMSPITQSFSSPSLSAKPSFNSISMSISKLGSQAPSDVLPCIMSDSADEWSLKLGHANFHILPEPYIPVICDAQTCAQLLDDWRAAQVEFWRQESLISEYYGERSQIYKFTREKWSAIESSWRSNFSSTCGRAKANGDTIDLEPFEATQSFAVPDKFPDIDDTDIVGPMTQYAKTQPSPTKRNTFLRLLTDPASILRKA